ncbi:MAG: PAS domain S-box protein [Emcibacter sp.]|nr:PAS domain S-box protein [Emcibacter sp.]
MDNHTLVSGQGIDILAEIINLSVDAIISLDKDQNIVLFNAAAEKIFGYKVSEVLGEPLNMLLPESVRSVHRGLVSGYDETGGPSRRMGQLTELYGVAKSGEFIPLDISIQKHPEGSSCRYTAICRDISHRLEREKKIRENEEKFRMLFNTSHHMTILMNEEGAVMEFNDTVNRILQVKAEKYIGKKIWDCEFWANEKDFSLMEVAVQKIKIGEEISFIANAVGENNRKIILEISLKKIQIEHNKTALIIIEAKDITEAVRSNKELVESKARLARAQKIAHIGNFEWTIVSNVLIWSEEAYRIFNLAPNGIDSTYESFLARVHPDDREHVEMTLVAALKGESPYKVSHRIILDDGTVKVAEQIGEILRTQDGKAVRMYGTTQDITERWNREQELIQARRRAEESDMAKAQFLSVVSHEHRTPLNAIIGFSAMIATEKLGEINIPAYRDYAVDISASGKDLLGLIQNILQVTNYELGAVKYKPQYLTAQSLLDNSLSIISNRANEKNINIETSVGTGIDRLFLDPELTQQILVHLVDNAIKFSEEGGIIEVNLYVKNGDFVIDVVDRGVGLEDAAEIFDLFVQKNMNPGRVYGGVGLGLTIVKNLTELQGGWVQVDSKLGKGSVFSVYFSCVKSEAVPILEMGQMA